MKQDNSPSRLQVNPSSAVGAVSHKYSLSSEYEKQKFQLYSSRAAVPAVVSADSAWTLERLSLLRSLKNIRITWSELPAIQVQFGCLQDYHGVSPNPASELCSSYLELRQSSRATPAIMTKLEISMFDFPDLNYFLYNFLQNSLLKLLSFFFPVEKLK